MPSTGSVYSNQTVTETRPDGVADAKEDFNKASADLIQLPEGGTAAWCTVIGA